MPDHTESCALCDHEPELLTWDANLMAYVCERCLPTLARQQPVMDVGRCPRCGALHEWRNEP